MSRHLSRLRYHLARLGWPAWLGAVLAGAGIGLDQAVNTPLELELDSAIERQQRALLVPRAERTAPAAVSGLGLGERDMAALAGLFAAAEAAGVQLDKGDYSLDAGGGRLRIQLPLMADYPALRSFLAGCLNAEPALLLDSLKVERPDSQTGELDVRVQFILRLASQP